METRDERIVRAPVATIFALVRNVEHWPALLAHYRYVRLSERATDGGGIVEMSANRPFGLLNWPTWWRSEMMVDEARPAVRFHHIGGVTKGMDVEWSFESVDGGTQVRLVHVWDGPRWPLIGVFAATAIIGPVFVHGIASRTLEGLARVAESGIGNRESGIGWARDVTGSGIPMPDHVDHRVTSHESPIDQPGSATDARFPIPDSR